MNIETLGCKLNQAESERLAEELKGMGYRLVSAVDEADVYILNTCSVTHIAERKSRQRLRMARRRNPTALLAAVGCYAQRTADKLAGIDGVWLVLDNDDKMKLPQILQQMNDNRKTKEMAAEYSAGVRSRSFVKAQDGCENFCAYCVVPLVRQQPKSLPTARIIEEINEKVAAVYREVVLTGTEIGSYNSDGLDLKGLIKKVLDETQVGRLRLSSLQPHHITPQLIGLWRNKKLCPHFHLSLQSGSDSMLKKMKRQYSSGDFQKAVSSIRALLSDAAITTDVIVGFPGESQVEFEQSCEFCRRMAFARIHVFPYSRRPGTAAAEMAGQVSVGDKKMRSQQMLALAEESAATFRRRFIGKKMQVLWEQKKGDIWNGLTENYIRVYARSREDLRNKITEVILEKLYKDGAWGRL